jgi:hypothetical protein
MTNKLEMIERRADISKVVVHLTRDDTTTFAEQGGPARENFLSILERRQIWACRPHSLYAAKVAEEHRDRFNVCCFTETPIDQLDRLTEYISGRQIHLEPWGLAFSREFMIEHGAQQVFYVNSYPTKDPVREGFDAIFDQVKLFGFNNSRWKVLPFVSAIQPGHDFGWEREVRVRGHLEFDYEDIEFAIVPGDVDMEVKSRLARLAIPMYTPGWSVEKFGIEMRKQMRRVQRLAVSAKPAIKPAVKIATRSAT